MRLQGNVEKRLAQVRVEVQRLRASLRVLDEQVAYQQEVADDAATRAVVAQTPLADRERHEALRDLEKLRRQREEANTTLSELTSEQDRLLDRMLG